MCEQVTKGDLRCNESSQPYRLVWLQHSHVAGEAHPWPKDRRPNTEGIAKVFQWAR